MTVPFDRDGVRSHAYLYGYAREALAVIASGGSLASLDPAEYAAGVLARLAEMEKTA